MVGQLYLGHPVQVQLALRSGTEWADSTFLISWDHKRLCCITQKATKGKGKRKVHSRTGY